MKKHIDASYLTSPKIGRGDISKDKEVVIVSSKDDQAEVKANVSTIVSPVTLEHVSHLLVDG